MSQLPRILIVDDEEQLLSLMSYALASGGYDVKTAKTAKRGTGTSRNPADRSHRA